jgi:hypothetical protein
MANNKFSKLVSLVLFGAGLAASASCIFVSTRTVEAKPAHTEVVSNQDKLHSFIANIKPVTVEAESSPEIIRPIAKVTSKVSKKSTPAAIKSGWTNCRVHVLEQQGSPVAQTVNVCW